MTRDDTPEGYRPTILITRAEEVLGEDWDDYARCVNDAGGEAVPFNCGTFVGTAELPPHDGILVTAGVDIAPARYRQVQSERVTTVDPDRDNVEGILIEHALGGGIPLFCICRGFQLLNVVRGGSLHQHLEEREPHRARRGEDGVSIDSGWHDVLVRADVSRADLVVACTDHDEVNLIAALAAKQLGAKRVVARAQGNEWAKSTEGIRYGLLGIAVGINPRVLVALELARVARSHGATDVIDIAGDRLELVQIELGEDTRAVDKPIMKLPLPREVLVAAVVRRGELQVPGGSDVLLRGDRIYLVGQPQAVLEAEDLFSRRREARRVCIVGGGVVGEALAKSLRKDARVMVIERNLERAEELSVLLEGVTVVHGDGTDKELLDEEEVGSYDLICAVTEADEVNLIAALLAKQVGVPRTAALVNRADYLPIYRQLGVNVVVTPRAVASDHILRYCRGGGVESLTQLEGGQAEVLELRVDRGSRAVGVPLRRLGLPRGTLLCAIVHGDEVVVPRGDDALAAGDVAVVLVTTAARASVLRLFLPRGAGA